MKNEPMRCFPPRFTKLPVKLFKFALALFLAFSIFLSSSVFAGLPLIRDEETESYIREISNPIFKIANLDSDSIKIYIVNDDSLNAFVAGGQNLFLNKGLITFSEDPTILIGVIAHEVGHLAGGHISLQHSTIKDVSIITVAGYLLGSVAAVASNSPEITGAIVSGTENIATKNYLRFSRTYENAADKAAIRYLETLNISPKGLLKLLEHIYIQQRSISKINNPYLSTHPLSIDRINFIKKHLQNKTYPKIDHKIKAKHQKIIAKIKAFTAGINNNGEEIIAEYETRDDISAEVKSYVKAIIMAQNFNSKEVLAIIQNLMATNPQNPYYKELMGYYYYRMGNIAKAQEYYAKSSKILPNSVMINYAYSVSLLNSASKADFQKARILLERIYYKEPTNTNILNQLAIAYGKLNMLDKSYLFLAKKALNEKNKKQAIRFAKLASEYATEYATEGKYTSTEATSIIKEASKIKTN